MKGGTDFLKRIDAICAELRKGLCENEASGGARTQKQVQRISAVLNKAMLEVNKDYKATLQLMLSYGGTEREFCEALNTLAKMDVAGETPRRTQGVSL